MRYFLIVALLSIQAFANTPGKHSVALTWTETNCPTCIFNVYRGSAAGVCSGTPTPYAIGVLTTSYTDTAVTAGQTYVYAVSAVNGGAESFCSSEAQTTVPSSPPTPTNLQGTTN